MEKIKAQKCWVNWRMTDRGKVPFVPGTMRNSKINDCNDWRWFKDAVQGLAQYDGIGLILHDNLVGIDIDGANGHSEDNPLSAEVLELFGETYAEKSPSGHGFHVLLTCDLTAIPTEVTKDGRLRLSPDYYQKNQHSGLEIYFGAFTTRYLTFTGERVSAGEEITDQTGNVLRFLEKYMRRSSATETRDTYGGELDEALSLARSSAEGEKFKALYDRGDISKYNNDRSSADLALCRLLAVAFKGNREKIDRAFRKSALFREKWDRSDYREMTIDKAISYAAAEQKPDLRKFHSYSDNGKLLDVIDYKIFLEILRTENIFILGQVPFIYTEGVYLPDYQGCRIKGKIKSFIFPEKIRSNVIDRIYRLFFSEPGLEKSMDEINNFPDSWINFKNAFFDPEKNCLVPHSPDFLSINQLSCEYDPEKEYQGKNIENWLNFSVPDWEDRRMLLEYAGLCFGRDLRFQKFMIVSGRGGTGKSTLLRLIQEIMGQRNCSNVSMESFQSRFSAISLLGKTVNICADIKSEEIFDTSMLKKLIGEDAIMAEAKGKDAISFKSYAKLLFSTNELPLIYNEKTDAFFRRMLLLKMNQKPEKVRLELFSELSEELEYFSSLCMKALCGAYAAGKIHESENSVRAVKSLRMDSDNSSGFVEERIISEPGARTERSEVYKAYTAYCSERELRPMERNELYKNLATKGFSSHKSHGTMVFDNLSLN